MQPTAEQTACVDAFGTGESLAVEAGAGVGKTTLMEMLARSTPRSGAYVAFNRAVVNDAVARMPLNINAATAHSFAMRAVGQPYRHRLDAPRMKSWRLAKLLGVDPLVVTGPFGRKVLQPSYLASLVLRAVTVFCQSDDREPSAKHFPYIDGIDDVDLDGVRGWKNNDLVRAELEDAVAAAWEDISDPDGQLPFGHSYLKVWELGDPVIPGEFLSTRRRT